MTALRTSAALFVLAAFLIVAAAVFTDMLPTQCGVVGRPIVHGWAVFSIGVGALLLIGGTLAGLRAKNRARRILIAVGAVETTGWIAAFLFYLHQTGGSYPNCL